MVSTASDMSSAFTHEQDPVTAPETCSRRTSWSCMTGCLADCWTVQPMQWLRPGLLLVGEAGRAAREPLATRYWVALLTPAAAAVRRRVPRVRVRCRVVACSAAEPCAGARYLVGSPTCGAQAQTPAMRPGSAVNSEHVRTGPSLRSYSSPGAQGVSAGLCAGPIGTLVPLQSAQGGCDRLATERPVVT